MVDRLRRSLFTRKTPSNIPRLPWLSHADTFTDLCSRCERCIENCETNIIVKGDGGFPQVDFSQGEGECTFCYQCADACPEPLFLPQSELPWNIIAAINESCMASKNIECRSCGDMCDPQAIKFQLQVGNVAMPTITDKDCTGCGACLSGCPTSAITITRVAHDTQ
ncbi:MULTISPECIES: ferredoxin-type protein NapF [unclassified Photobacterium]|uniref:ferredoxin-type protein NapF n=1 Tax=unclassified Photobacterium TaxID=2628852 RepID=UPI001EDE0AAA|nr:MULTISPECIES: ferredoxin-type protein NapF [unclassified Photobacterium]MCG3862450.1 ferredoxin-type protein NapF [Photobacterium sp. Ph6]MCG3874051.1 ferredoxin-type protein NapF [Photobacterium sp. Ph5]